MLKEVIGRKLAVFNISSLHPRFKKYRKLLHTSLNGWIVQEYYPLFKEEGKTLLKGLSEKPERFISHLRQ